MSEEKKEPTEAEYNEKLKEFTTFIRDTADMSARRDPACVPRRHAIAKACDDVMIAMMGADDLRKLADEIEQSGGIHKRSCPIDQAPEFLQNVLI